MPNTLPPLIARHMAERVRLSLLDTPAVLINGPRQCGKTTLAKQFSHGMQYITLDDATVLEVARMDPVGLVRKLDRAIIDEVQRAPQLLLALKHAIDEDRRPGRFLLTGSSNLLSLPQVADSLAGRMEVHTLLPLSQSELQGRANDFLQRAQTHDWPIANPQWATPAVHGRRDTVVNVLAGGFPDMRSRASHSRQLAWANAYIKTLVERDVRDVAQIEHLSAIRDCYRLSPLTVRNSSMRPRSGDSSHWTGELSRNIWAFWSKSSWYSACPPGDAMNWGGWSKRPSCTSSTPGFKLP
jgi:uncharacterized protein